jgi:diguanylate cyclase (GGDEF)-like protein/PAS domain S-box-containing protein
VRTNEIYFSRQWKAMLGYEDHEIPNHLDEWTKRLHPEDRDRAVDSAQAYLMGLLPAYEISFRMLHRDGSYRWILARGAALYNADGRPYRMAGSHTDITDRMEYEAQLETQMLQLNEAHVQLEIEQAKLRELNAHLEKLATTDGLTGLKNHRAFQEHLEQEIERARRYNYSLSLALLDVDKFKAYNDTFGHPAGDQVLKQVGATLLKTARKSDLPARYGGEEFAVILPHTDKAGALRFAERLRKAIEKIKDPNRAISASLGVATLTPVMADRAELIAQADAALYASKKAGRNRVTHYTALHEMQEEVREVKEECRVG